MRHVPLVLVAAISGFALNPSSVAAQSHEPSHAPAPHAGPHWTYRGAEGPQHWGELDPSWRACSAGHEQSPIDLGAAIRAHDARFDERIENSPFVLFHNGHTVQAALAHGSTLTESGRAYQSLQFHFHAPSEHTVKGKAYPAELHLVHRDSTGALAVLGVFIAKGAKDNPELEALLSHFPRATGDSIPFTQPVDLAALLANRGSDEPYFRYHGSLTTPPCSEGVQWIVRERPIVASETQLRRLVTVLGKNARPVQPLFARHD